MKDVYGKLGKDETFQKKFAEALKSIEDNGVEGALKKYVETYK